SMKKHAWNGVRGSSALMLLFASIAITHAETWNLTSGGSWNNPANWTPGSVPNGIGASATFTSIQTTDRVITFDAVVTIGTLDITNGTSFSNTIGVGFTAPPITFDAPGSNAATISVLSSADRPAQTTSGTLVFADPTKEYTGATIVNGGKLRIDAPLSAPSRTSALTVNSSGQIAL